MLEMPRVYSIDEPNTMVIGRNPFDLRKIPRLTNLNPKLVFTQYLTLGIYFIMFSDTDISIYLGFIGEEKQFYQVTFRNRHLSMRPFGSDREF